MKTELRFAPKFPLSNLGEVMEYILRGTQMKYILVRVREQDCLYVDSPYSHHGEILAKFLGRYMVGCAEEVERIMPPSNGKLYRCLEMGHMIFYPQAKLVEYSKNSHEYRLRVKRDNTSTLDALVKTILPDWRVIVRDNRG